MLLSLFGVLLAVLNFVQVPQWDVDWKECSVSVPDTACHWYVVDPDNTFGKGFSWITAPSFDAEGVRDIALQRQATEAQGYRCLLYTSPSPRDGLLSRMPSSA